MTERVYSIDLGMPFLGLNNLSECALFKALGDDRWRHLQELGGVTSSAVVDDMGLRLYATFFFVDVCLSPKRPLSHYGENQVITFETGLSHFGKTHLDGYYRIEGTPDWIRMSNVFIHQKHGPAKLAVGF